MKIITGFLIISITLTACSSGVHVQRSNVHYFDSGFSSTVANKSVKVKGRAFGDPPLLQLFRIQDVKADSVQVFFAGDKLTFRYTQNDRPVEKQFAGQFKSKGYYEYYFSREIIEIPPVIPIFFSRSNVNRIRLALTNEGDLIVDNKWVMGGNILILGAGDAGRRQSFFKTKPLTPPATYN